MDVIVPLAGPDFVKSDGSIKALTPFAGEPLLRSVLRSRPWASTAKSYTFILQDTDETRAFADKHLRQWFPHAILIFLSATTRGAACTALAGISCCPDPFSPVIIDLADIHYELNLDIVSTFEGSLSCGALALTFQSSNPLYSYLRTDDTGKFVEAAEKKVISRHASAGTYVFRNSNIYLQAMAHAFSNEATQSYNGLFYVCPLFNGVLSHQMDVKLFEVDHVEDLKVASSIFIHGAPSC